MILGIDEVGRGPWAGPLVIGAVVLGDAQIDGLTDSKKLTAKKRQELDILIRNQAAGFGLGWVSAQEIDEIGLSESLRLAARRAVEQIETPYHEIIIDGTINFLKDTSKGKYVTTLKKADLLIPSVSAASIIAKVARDTFMTEQALLYPEYGFASHVGYGTAAHQAAIAAHGVTPLHRLSFGPLKQYKDETPNHVTSGAVAESIAADWLLDNEFRVFDRNWKVKAAEIDIVAEKSGKLYFVEVKYRKQAAQGGGVAAITPTKLRAMQKGAEIYTQVHGLEDSERQLAVITLTGEPPIVEQFLLLE
jgi:ribonuclease HII